MEKKPNCASVYRKDFRIFKKTGNLNELTKEVAYFDQLTHWQNTDVNRIRLFDFF